MRERMGRAVWGRLLSLCVAAVGGSACMGSTVELSTVDTSLEGGPETGTNTDAVATVDSEASADAGPADGGELDEDSSADASPQDDADDANADALTSADAEAQSETNAASEASADAQADDTVDAEASADAQADDTVDAEASADAQADDTVDAEASADADATATTDATEDATADATAVAIAIDNPPPSTVDQGASYTFSATVLGAANASATFAVSTGCGSINASTGAYLAPNQSAASCTLTATSVADNTKTAAAIFSVNSVNVVLYPTTAAVAPNQTSGFVATVTGTVNKAVSYGVVNGGVGGTINSLGVYYAPGMTGSDTVIAISAADATKSATANATVTTTVAVSVLPSTATLNQGQSQSFSATVTGNANSNVSWNVVGGKTNGTITPNGVYTAPSANGSYTVMATSLADGSKTSSATVTVTSAPQVAVSISPPSVTIAAGQKQHFAATVSGSADQSVNYSVLEAAGGTVDGAGNYAAPLGSGVYHVVVASNADPTKTATATVTVTTGPPVAIAVSPSSVTLPPNGAKAFTATVTGSTNTAVIWSSPSCGTIDSVGNYTAPATAPTTCTFTVTSAGDSTKSATATVSVSSTIAVSVSPSPTTVTVGGTARLIATVTGTANALVDWTLIGAAGTGSVDANGLYTTVGATATPPFSVTLRATSRADNTKTGQAAVNVVASSVYTVSGTVTYGGSAQLGNVYLDVLESGNGTNLVGGTVIAGAGPFTIRCLRSGQPHNYYVKAWNDVAGYVSPVLALDQAATTGVFSFTGSANVTGLTVNLVDPSPSVPSQAPTIQQVIAADGAGVLLFKRVTDANGHDVADHYNVYVSTLANPGPQNNIMVRRIGSWAETNAGLDPLANGTPYYVAVTAVNSAGEGPAGFYGPFTVGASTGANTVSGTVDLSGITATGPLYVYVGMGDKGPNWITRVAHPSGIVSYKVSGVPNGAVRFGVRLDQLDDGVLGPLDPSFDGGGFTVSGDTSAPAIVLPNGNGVASITTDHQLFPGGSEAYALNFRAVSGTKLVTKAVLGTGTNVGTSVPYDLGVSLNDQRASLGVDWFNVGSVAPLVNDSDSMTVTYSDGTTETLSASITGIVALATNLMPNTAGAGVTPGFTWAPPSPAPASYTYEISVFTSGMGQWDIYGLPSSQSQPVTYNFDGKGKALSSGVQYQWWLYAQDAQGNRSATGAVFTP
jgi:hypothetical protein